VFARRTLVLSRGRSDVSEARVVKGVEVGNDPTQVKVDWDVIDVLAISYTGMPGFPVTDNFLLL
jgi:hypothetical protein